jgi:acetyltransferase-like isoleucine patch superfamily enzyme
MGNKLFNFFYPIMKGLSILLYLIPTFILKILWKYLDIFPSYLGVGLRYIFALRLCKRIGKNVYFGEFVTITDWNKLEIGSNVSIHKDCYIISNGGIIIGNEVSIAHSSSILSVDHTWENKTLPIRSNPLKMMPINICDDVWIGCGSRILGNVTINSRVIVAAGSVVTKNIPQNVIVAGIPANIKKEI